MKKLDLAVKVIVAGILIGCLAKVPYGYFQFVRLASFIAFLWLTTIENNRKRLALVVGCVCCAILLNPIIKIHFVRETWNLIDVIIAIALLIWVLVDFILIKKSLLTDGNE